MMIDAFPNASVIGLLVNPSNPNVETLSRDAQAAAQTLGLEVHVLNANTERDFDAVFAALAQRRAGALVIGADAFVATQSEQLATLTLRDAVPAISQYHEFARAGGLMSYGGSSTDQARLAGTYTARILKGEKPADLPVQQVTKVELIVNLKTARALGLAVPLPLLALADEVIESAASSSRCSEGLRGGRLGRARSSRQCRWSGSFAARRRAALESLLVHSGRATSA